MRHPIRWIGLVVAGVVALLALTAPAALAHVVPTSSVQLSLGDTSVTASVTIPVDDLSSAGVDVDDEGSVDTYLLAHFAPTSDDGTAWTVATGDYTVSTTGNAATTGRYQALTTTFTLVPASGESLTSFDLGYDAIVESVATHAIVVTYGDSDGTVFTLGTIKRDTVTNTVETLHVDLGAGGGSSGFTGMLALGMDHIKEGTDHQLFLLTLLLPAPLLASGRRWVGTGSVKQAIGRITRVTLAFTVGHSVTLALGALGLPVPISLVEALIALSILIAAVHAARPLFPGREALVAGSFGLVHGLAFSEALRDLNLTGHQLVLSLLGFNLGIEAMQLIVVAFVLPPLIMFARANRYKTLRLVVAGATGVAALGWMVDRLGQPNPIASAADQLGNISVPVVAALWISFFLFFLRRKEPQVPLVQAFFH